MRFLTPRSLAWAALFTLPMLARSEWGVGVMTGQMMGQGTNIGAELFHQTRASSAGNAWRTEAFAMAGRDDRNERQALEIQGGLAGLAVHGWDGDDTGFFLAEGVELGLLYDDRRWPSEDYGSQGKIQTFRAEYPYAAVKLSPGYAYSERGELRLVGVFGHGLFQSGHALVFRMSLNGALRF